MLGRLVALLLFASLAAAQRQDGAAGRVEGYVIGPLAEPVVAAEVRVTRGEEVIARTATDGLGFFVVRGLPLSDDYLLVRATAQDKHDAVDHVRVSVDSPRDTASLRLFDAGSVHGRVLGADGEPVAGAHVIATASTRVLSTVAERREGRTDGEGRYRLDKVPLGEIAVRAVAPGHAMASARSTCVESPRST